MRVICLKLGFCRFRVEKPSSECLGACELCLLNAIYCPPRVKAILSRYASRPRSTDTLTVSVWQRLYKTLLLVKSFRTQLVCLECTVVKIQHISLRFHRDNLKLKPGLGIFKTRNPASSKAPWFQSLSTTAHFSTVTIRLGPSSLSVNTLGN